MNTRQLIFVGLPLFQEAVSRKFNIPLAKITGDQHTTIEMKLEHPEGFAHGYILNGIGVEGHVVFIHGAKCCVVTITRARLADPPFNGAHVEIANLKDRTKLHD